MVVGEFSQEAELVVIGGGPGGYSCAFRAAELGVQTVLVDPREQLGGVCLHEGCVPSKTLLHVAEIVRLIGHAKRMGVETGPPRVDVEQVRKWVGEAVATLSKGLAGRARKHKIEHVRGEAHFEDGRSIRATGETPARVRFRRAVIATGAMPIEHPSLPYDGERVVTPAAALALNDFPESLMVIGENYQAVEIAVIYSALGCETTLISEHANLLGETDADLTRPLVRGLRDQLSAAYFGAIIDDATLSDTGVRMTIRVKDKATTIDAARAVICRGYRGRTADLTLEKTGVERNDDGFIPVNEELRSSDPRIFAVGDVTGPPLLADRALHQGRIAAEVVAGWGSSYDAAVVPHVIFSDPQVAWCGVTEAQAKAEGQPIAVRRIPWGASGRAVGMGRADGMTKIIFDPDTQLVLGAGIVGPHASEMIGEAVLAIEMGAVLTDLAASIHPHPTMCELISDAAREAEHDARS